MIPTDGAYAVLFDFKDVAYSQQAAAVGYPSRYFIVNSGSIPIFMLYNLVLQLIVFGIVCCIKDGRLNRFAVFKSTSFRWAGFNDFINEIYLTQSFAICINTSSMGFVSLSVGINNTFGSIIAVTLIVVPIIISIRAHLQWKRELLIGAAKVELKEGGEEESKNGAPTPRPTTKAPTTKGKKTKKGKKKASMAKMAAMAPNAPLVTKNYQKSTAGLTAPMRIQTDVTTQGSMLLIDDVPPPANDEDKSVESKDEAPND